MLSNKTHKISYVIWLWTTSLCSHSYLWNLILLCNLHKNNNLFIFHLYPFSLYQVQYCYAMVRSVWLILAGYAKALDININVNVWISPGGQALKSYSEYIYSFILKLRKTLIYILKKIEHKSMFNPHSLWKLLEPALKRCHKSRAWFLKLERTCIMQEFDNHMLLNIMLTERVCIAEAEIKAKHV